MKQTAVEFLVEQITLPELGENPQWVQDAIDQSKEMEKEQIMNCCIQTTQDCYIAIMDHLNAPLQFTDEDLSNQKLEAEQYYNETFKSE
jgi:hypothetical protein